MFEKTPPISRLLSAWLFCSCFVLEPVFGSPGFESQSQALSPISALSSLKSSLASGEGFRQADSNAPLSTLREAPSALISKNLELLQEFRLFSASDLALAETLMNTYGSVHEEIMGGSDVVETALGEKTVYHGLTHSLGVPTGALSIALGTGSIRSAKMLKIAFIAALLHDLDDRMDGLERVFPKIGSPVEELSSSVRPPSVKQTRGLLQTLRDKHPDLYKVINQFLGEENFDSLPQVQLLIDRTDFPSDVEYQPPLAVAGKIKGEVRKFRSGVEEILSELESKGFAEAKAEMLGKLTALAESLQLKPDTNELESLTDLMTRIQVLSGQLSSNLESEIRTQSYEIGGQKRPLSTSPVVGQNGEEKPSELTRANALKTRLFAIENNFLGSVHAQSLQGNPEEFFDCLNLSWELEVADQSSFYWLFTENPTRGIVEALGNELPGIGVGGTFLFFLVPEIFGNDKAMSILSRLPEERKKNLLRNAQMFSERAFPFIQKASAAHWKKNRERYAEKLGLSVDFYDPDTVKTLNDLVGEIKTMENVKDVTQWMVESFPHHWGLIQLKSKSGIVDKQKQSLWGILENLSRAPNMIASLSQTQVPGIPSPAPKLASA